MSAREKLRPFPTFVTDEEAEQFVATADLSEYDFSNFRPVRFEFTKTPERLKSRSQEGLPLATRERSARQAVHRPPADIVRKAAIFMTHPERATHEDIQRMAARILDDGRKGAKTSGTKQKTR